MPNLRSLANDWFADGRLRHQQSDPVVAAPTAKDIERRYVTVVRGAEENVDMVTPARGSIDRAGC